MLILMAMNIFYKLGCRNLQLDDTSWGEFCAEDKRKTYTERGLDLDQIAKDYVYMLNKIVAAKPADLAITMHICRGNFRSTWFSAGGYEPIAETLFGHCNVDGFFLEYDSDRAGDFKPLRFIKNQQVVLGLITSKSGELENRDEIIARIKEAAQYVDINQLCLSPQCGFASTEEGNILTEEQQWKKLDLSIVSWKKFGVNNFNWNEKEIIIKMVISFFMKVRLKMTALLHNKKRKSIDFLLCYFNLIIFDALQGIGSHHG